ncbi:MAG: FAD-dependent oxidoreductase [Pseudomonadota bacterium]
MTRKDGAIANVVRNAPGPTDIAVDVLIIGAGACGCCAALAAKESGASVLIVERDATPSGSTSLSSGMIPAAGTALQEAAGIADTAELLAGDLIAKAKDKNNAAIARHVAAESAPTIDWLAETHNLPFSTVDTFRYPGHSAYHMHGVPSLDGSELLATLLSAVTDAGVDIVTSARAKTLVCDESGRISAVGVERPDGSAELIGCGALVLACNGYGGNPQMVERFIPQMSKAHYHGHQGNQGEAVRWGEQLGCRIADMGSYQGHGGVVTPQMVHLGWACVTEGGFQVNNKGERFSHENEGYSEQAIKILTQPDGIAWTIFDERCHDIAKSVHSHREGDAMGAIGSAQTVAALAKAIGCKEAVLAQTLADVEAMAAGQLDDPFGRDFTTRPALQPPYRFAKVTGALFHTQGGLEVNEEGRVLLADGGVCPNLFAGGGAARGLSGPSDWGYLSGSGLLMAVTLGRLAGSAAAHQVLQSTPDQRAGAG